MLRIDPHTRRLAGPPLTVGRDLQDLAVGAGAVWVATGERPGPTGAPRCELVGVDPRSLRVFRRQPIDCGPGKRIDAGPRDIWSTGSSGTRGLTRVRARGARLPLRGVQLPGESTDVAAGLGRVWVTGLGYGPAGPPGGKALLSALDPESGRVSTSLVLADAPAGLPRVAVGAGAVWVANAPTGTIARIDPALGMIVARVRPAPASVTSFGTRSPARALGLAVPLGLALLGASAAGGSGGAAGGAGGPVPARVATGLPAPVVIATAAPRRCAARALPSGRVDRVPRRSTVRQPPGSAVFPLAAPEAAVLLRRGRVVLRRRGALALA